jgi:hypothetical protein
MTRVGELIGSNRNQRHAVTGQSTFGDRTKAPEVGADWPDALCSLVALYSNRV